MDITHPWNFPYQTKLLHNNTKSVFSFSLYSINYGTESMEAMDSKLYLLLCDLENIDMLLMSVTMHFFLQKNFKT